MTGQCPLMTLSVPSYDMVSAQLWQVSAQLWHGQCQVMTWSVPSYDMVSAQIWHGQCPTWHSQFRLTYLDTVLCRCYVAVKYCLIHGLTVVVEQHSWDVALIYPWLEGAFLTLTNPSVTSCFVVYFLKPDLASKNKSWDFLIFIILTCCYNTIINILKSTNTPYIYQQ